MILSQKDKADRNHTKLKEIQEKINDRCEMINEKQSKMLASLLDKLFNKIKINRLVKKESFQRSLLLETNKILAHTKEHFSSQFEEKSLNLKEMPDNSGASGISYTLIKATGPFLQQIFKKFTDKCLTFLKETTNFILQLFNKRHAKVLIEVEETEIFEYSYMLSIKISTNIVSRGYIEKKWRQAVLTFSDDTTWLANIQKQIEEIINIADSSTKLTIFNSKLNFKAIKTLEKLNIFYTNQLILQDGTMLATWGQLKLIKNATKKGKKPIWVRYIESIILQDTATRKIKDDLSINANLKGLAISNLQRFSSDNRVKD
ncbi:44356_t:CDS:2 [Gigaspora margarita]|uniref:44356_t:CDS:1 n=1 Tax=Gigaspora margarita TaxID=4874 RepID=A0ABN7UA07_GIGMA|nr:44356_t:CDS:2 [Gigaspora margarita]